MCGNRGGFAVVECVVVNGVVDSGGCDGNGGYRDRGCVDDGAGVGGIRGDDDDVGVVFGSDGVVWWWDW